MPLPWTCCPARVLKSKCTEKERERSFLALGGTFCFHRRAKCRHFEIVVRNSTCRPRREKPARPGRPEDKHPWLRLPDRERFTAATAETVCYGEDKQEAPFQSQWSCGRC